MGEQNRPMGMWPCGAEGQVGKKDRGHKLGATDVFCVAFTVPKNDYAQLPSCEWLIETPWTVTLQAPLSLGFPRQEYRSGLPISSPGIEDVSGQGNFSVGCYGK